jgi:hypothetical protein
MRKWADNHTNLGTLKHPHSWFTLRHGSKSSLWITRLLGGTPFSRGRFSPDCDW